ncbi:MAG: hypothetical protein AAFX87_09260 [Bacteroidota bacterium]
MKMLRPLLLSTNVLVVAFTVLLSCSHSNSGDNANNSDDQLPDSLHAFLDIAKDYGSLKGTAITDSLKDFYIHHVGENNLYDMKVSPEFLAFDLNQYRLDGNVYAKLIRFQHDFDSYNSIYLFLIREDGETILDALELSNSFFEEGVNGDAEAFIISEDNATKVYKHQYWVSYVGSDAEVAFEIDTIRTYIIDKNGISESIVDKSKAKEIEALFAD